MSNDNSHTPMIHWSKPFYICLLALALLTATGCATQPINEELRERIKGLAVRNSPSVPGFVVWDMPTGGRALSEKYFRKNRAVKDVRQMTFRSISSLANHTDSIPPEFDPKLPANKKHVEGAMKALQQAFTDSLAHQIADLAPYPVRAVTPNGTPGTSVSQDEMTLEVGLKYVSGHPEIRHSWVHFELAAHVRLLPPGASAPVFERNYAVGSEALNTEKWTADGGARLRRTLARQMADLQEWISEDLLLRHDLSVPTADRGYQIFQIKPIEPEVDFCFNCRGLNELVSVDSLKPTFKWTPIPRPENLKKEDRNSSRKPLQGISNVTYDLRIYRDLMPIDFDTESVAVALLFNPMAGAAVRTQHMVGGELVYERTGLPKTEHTVEEPLPECDVYMWTVRARFQVNGHQRATEWASAAPSPLSEYRTSYAAMMGSANPSFFYFRILPPCAAREAHEAAEEEDRQRAFCNKNDLRYSPVFCKDEYRQHK